MKKNPSAINFKTSVIIKILTNPFKQFHNQLHINSLYNIFPSFFLQFLYSVPYYFLLTKLDSYSKYFSILFSSKAIMLEIMVTDTVKAFKVKFLSLININIDNQHILILLSHLVFQALDIINIERRANKSSENVFVFNI